MLTCSLQKPITSITTQQQLNAPNTFSISYLSAGVDTAALLSEVTIYRDNTAIMTGVITAYSYNVAAGVMTVTGQDKVSYTAAHDGRPNALVETPVASLTTVADAINSVARGMRDDPTADVIDSCPSIPCYGYGAYNGNTQQIIDRICNSFGLDYYATGTGYTLTAGGIDTPISPTSYAAAAIMQGSDSGKIISDIYVQRAITRSNRQSLAIKNSSLSSTQQVRLINPNAVDVQQGQPQFPKDYFLDPWTKTFVTIDVPVATVVYSVATSIAAAKKITYASCNDTLVNPAWRLEVWDNDPGTGAVPSANRLAYLSAGESWTAVGNETALALRVARDIQSNGQNITTYPTYDGVAIKCYAWPTLDDADYMPWSASYSSGDTDGRPDINVITDPMYPSKTTFDQLGLGQQIARRDSVKLQRGLSIPGTPAIGIRSGAAASYDGTQYALPVTSISYTYAAGQERTDVRGEW